MTFITISSIYSELCYQPLQLSLQSNKEQRALPEKNMENSRRPDSYSYRRAALASNVDTLFS